jgi:hypothetical protein
MPPPTPHPRWDSTIALFRDPYRGIARECSRQRPDVFASRLLLRPTMFMTGPHAAALFSDPERFMVDRSRAGEWSTIEVMRRVLDVLVHRLHYVVPEQDHRLVLAHLPALPHSRFVMTDVRVAA